MMSLECLTCWCTVFCLLWRHLQCSRCQKWHRGNTNIFFTKIARSEAEPRSTTVIFIVGLLQALLEALGFCCGQKGGHEVGHCRHLLKAEESWKGPCSGASWQWQRRGQLIMQKGEHSNFYQVLCQCIRAAPCHRAAQAFLCLHFISAVNPMVCVPVVQPPVLRPGITPEMEKIRRKNKA